MADRTTLDETKTQIAFRMPEPPVIDGIVDQSEWAFGGYHPKSGAKGWFWQVRFDDRVGDDGNFVVEDNIRGGAIGDGAGSPPFSLTDLAYAIFVGYDDQNLYIAVRVDDDALVDDSAAPDSANGTTWLDDSVEVFIDGDNSNFETRDTTGTNPDIVNTGGQFVITINNAYREAEAGNPGYGENAAWFAKTTRREDGSGYDAEFRISLSKIGNPKFGDIIGFSVAVNDDDDGGNLERQLMWSGKPHTESGYGNLIIEGKSYTAPKVNQAPVVDGTINPSEYPGAQEIVVNPHTGTYDLREGDDNFPVGDNGFSAWVVHDNDAVYVAILAVDDKIMNDNADPGSLNGNTWDDDSVEIYFDADDSNDLARGSGAFEGQYVFTANGAVRTAEANGPILNTDWFAANKIVQNGYATEFKVLKTSLFNPADGASLGFHIDMNDDDGNLNKGRKGQIGWSGRSHMEHTYGVLTLAGATVPLTIERIALSGNDVEITINSQADLAKHALERSSGIAPAQWQSVAATFSAGAAGKVVAKLPKPSGTEFFRAVVNP
jgi:hypothetical protein